MSGSAQEGIHQDLIDASLIDGLYGYALVLSRNPIEAQDLVQETYVRALQAMHRLRENSNIKGWLSTILRNLWLDELRRRKIAPHIVDIDDDAGSADWLAGDLKDPLAIYVEAQDAQKVRLAIMQLPIESREIIVLREFQELSYQQIAGVLACPIGTVMSRLGRARAKLRAILEDTKSPP